MRQRQKKALNHNLIKGLKMNFKILFDFSSYFYSGNGKISVFF